MPANGIGSAISTIVGQNFEPVILNVPINLITSHYGLEPFSYLYAA